MQKGDQFTLNPNFKGIAEIIGMYPGGQGILKVDHWEILIDGEKILLDEKFINILFKKLEKVVTHAN